MKSLLFLGMNKNEKSGKEAMQKAHEELSSYGSVSALDLDFEDSLQSQYAGMTKILQNQVLKTLGSFKFRADCLGNREKNPNARAYNQVLAALAESLAGMSRASKLDLDFCKNFSPSLLRKITLFFRLVIENQRQRSQ
jgi:hypothetical protein